MLLTSNSMSFTRDIFKRTTTDEAVMGFDFLNCIRSIVIQSTSTLSLS